MHAPSNATIMLVDLLCRFYSVPLSTVRLVFWVIYLEIVGSQASSGGRETSHWERRRWCYGQGWNSACSLAAISYWPHCTDLSQHCYGENTVSRNFSGFRYIMSCLQDWIFNKCLLYYFTMHTAKVKPLVLAVRRMKLFWYP